MIGTLLALLTILLLYVNHIEFSEEMISRAAYLPAAMLILAFLFIFARIMITLFAWAPLQKVEQNLCPRATEFFRFDRRLRIINFTLTFFLFFTFLAVINSLFLKIFDKKILFALWTLFLGISIDILYHYLNRVMTCLDPFSLIEFFSKSALACIRGGEEAELCGWIDSLSETSLKAVKKDSPSLSIEALEKLQLIARHYLEAAKGITYLEKEGSKKFGGADHVSYTLFYLFQRFELIFDKALNEALEPVCSKIVTILGKIIIHGAKYDITLAAYPIHYIGKFSARAQRKGLQEVGNRAELTLLETAKILTAEIDFQYLEIKDTFLTLINNMHSIAKDTFRSDKSVNIRVLIQPFEELRLLFKSPKLDNHQDTPSIVSHIDRVIGEFTTLQTVMSTMPPISEITKERTELEAEKEQASQE